MNHLPAELQGFLRTCTTPAMRLVRDQITAKPTVIFKHEDEVDGEAMGPVWLSSTGKLPSARWVTLPQAHMIANVLGLTLEEQ